jgi:hypothetical protein
MAQPESDAARKSPITESDLRGMAMILTTAPLRYVATD